MRKTFQTGGIAMAIAMVAISAPAVAQDRGGDRGDRGGRQERRVDEGRGPSPEAQRPAPTPQAQPVPQQRAPEQVQAQQRQNWQGRGPDQRNWQQGQGRFDRGTPGQADRDRFDRDRGQGNRPDQGNRFQDRRDTSRRDQYRGQGQFPGQGQYQGQQDRGQPGRGHWQRDRGRPDQVGRDQLYRGQNDGRYDRRDDRGPNGYDRDRGRDQWRGDQARGGYGRDDRRDWNRGWHGDRRYDWNGYRARNRDAYRLGGYYAPYRGYSYRRVSIGFSLQPLFFGSSYWIGDPYQYRLPPAYGPYRWVRYYDDALLVDIYTGEVVDTVYDIFW